MHSYPTLFTVVVFYFSLFLFFENEQVYSGYTFHTEVNFPQYIKRTGVFPQYFSPQINKQTELKQTKEKKGENEFSGFLLFSFFCLLTIVCFAELW